MKNKNEILTPLFVRLFIPLGIGYFFSVAVGCANALMTDELVAEFSLTPSDLGLLSSVYLITFGIAQFPMGILLDRVGVRRTLAPFFAIAAFGAALFAYAENFALLIAARALLGIGFSASLMAAFKAYASWLDAESLPLAYSLETLMGGLGGIFASHPIALAFDLLGWHSVFYIFTAISVAVAFMVWFMVPDEEAKDLTVGEAPITLLKKMFALLGNMRLMRLSAVVSLGEALYFAYLFLWIGPWMSDVAGFSDAAAAWYLVLAYTGAAAGYLLNGVFAGWLERKKIMTWEGFLVLSVGLTALSSGAMAYINDSSAAPLWGIAAFASTSTMISFPIARRMFCSEEVGRALSLMNFLIFAASFVVQWLIGVVLSICPTSAGHFSPEGHRICLAALAVLNLIICLWYCAKDVRKKKAR
ncbi:MAG: MFS transporter [Synergistes sp.]|nr:MFS transporter [Synergistes sp.]